MSKPRRRALRLLLQLGLGSFVLGLSGVGLGVVWLRRSLPDLSGQVDVAGIDAAVDIVRDENAIPHVFAHGERDAYFGLGFVHAQDRLWQLELTRRAGSGRLAEVFGRDALGEDRLLRTLGLRRSAERDLATLDAGTRGMLESYAHGVDAGRAQLGLLPPEFVLFGIEPEPWTPVDSLVVLELVAWQLSVQLGRELLRARLTDRLAPAQIAELLGGGEAAAPNTPRRALFGALAPAWRVLGEEEPERASEALGSNAWAVSGAHTASGKPLLANDPHLGLSMPAVWYLAHLGAPGQSVIGATIPGVPGIILGRNERVAWGFTNHRADALDLYVERLDPADPARYLVPGGSAPFDRVEERIAVRGEAPVVLSVRSTRHGPVISDADEAARRVLPDGHVLALEYAALRPGDTSIRFPLAVAHARDVQGVLRAARELSSPPQNVVSADVDGGIAWVAAGRVPRRNAAIAATAPMPGWLAEYDWQGFLPFEELPQVLRPDSGRIVSANQDPTPPSYPYWLGADWADPVRADRIQHELGRRERHDVASFASLQLDQFSQRAAELVGAFLPQLPLEPPTAPRLAEVIQRLRAWDDVMRPDTPEPLLFAEWRRELTRAVFQDELGEAFENVSSRAGERLDRLLSDAPSVWCDDVRTAETEVCPSLGRAALERALATLTERYGDDPGAWRWGDAHRAHFSSLPLGQLPLIGGWFDTVLPVGGGNDTVNLAEYTRIGAGEPLSAEYGPSYRAIYDLGEPEASSFVVAVGQSGNPFSPYYRHWAERWRKGESVPMRTERSAIEGTAVGTLLLRPLPL